MNTHGSPAQTPGRAGAAGRRWRFAAVVAGGVVLVAGVVTFGLWEGRSVGTGEDDGLPFASPSASSSAVEPLRGEATASARRASRTVSGLPRGFPRTEAGAVEAGASYVGSIAELYRMTSAGRWSYVRDARIGPPSVAELDADASTSSLRAPGSDCHPALGAYRVVAASAHETVVDYWLPCVVIAADVQSRWQMGRMTLRWDAGDWRVAELAQGPFDRVATPEPEGDPVTTFTERLDLLGEGWVLFADATEEWPLPPVADGVW